VYTPILRNRQSELLALKELATGVKTICAPLLDLAAPSKTADQLQARTYTERNIARMATAMKGFSKVLVDSSELNSALRIHGNKHPLAEAGRALMDAGCTPVPVTGLHRDPHHLSSALEIKNSVAGGILCVRLDSTDIGTATLTHKRLKDFIAKTSLNAADVLLLLDLKSLYGDDRDAVILECSRFLKQVSSDSWRGVILAGYGFPDQIRDAVAVREQGYISRIEQDLFFRLKQLHNLPDIWFGDYATVSPSHVELDWRIVSKVMGPKAMYALPDSWFVVRGSPFSSHKDGYGQYHDIASEIVALAEFPGPSYSFGDKYISECAAHAITSGSPSSWIKACANHHITLTALTHTVPSA